MSVFGIENYHGFVAAIVAFQIVPGPGTLAILNATARGGVRSGMDAVFGTLAGDFLYMLGAVLGLAALLAAHPAVLASLQWIGIGYLCWLGLQLLRSPAPQEADEAGRRRQQPGQFRGAFAVSLTNPKVILFFMAFFPLFLRPHSHAVTLVVMMIHVSLISLCYQWLLVLVGNAVALRLARVPGIGTLARRVVGVGLIGFGLRLALKKK